MLAELEAAVEGLEIGLDGAELARAQSLVDRFSAKLSAAYGDFDAAGLWDLDSATSMTAWLRHHAGMTKREAAHATSRAKRLRGLPATAAAWHAGELSGGQVDAVVAGVKANMVDLFAEHEAGLVPSLVGLSVSDTARAVAHWSAHASALHHEPEAAEPRRALHLSQTLDGTWALDAILEPEGGEVVVTALRLAQSADTEGEPARTPSQRRADALGDVCRYFLDHQTHHPAGRHRPHLNLVIDLEDLEAGRAGGVLGGSSLDGPSMQALLCDSVLHRLVMSGRSAVLDYGTATRTIPAPLWNALVVRDEHCRFPGCDRPSSWCEGHHVVPVVENGPTCLPNLALLCSRHHHRLHQPGWQAKLRPDATLEVTDPGGRHWSTAPPRAGPPRQAAPAA